MPESKTNHQPWDDGAVDDAFKSVFGASARELTSQKTVKTRCNKRVPVARAVAGKPITCGNCNEQINSTKEFTLEAAIAVNDQHILRSIAERTLHHAVDYVFEQTWKAPELSEAQEILLQAQEQVIAEQIAARGI